MEQKTFNDLKQYIENKYNIISFNEGHYKITGKDAYKYKNPYWIVNKNDENIKILMYCEKNTCIQLCPVSLEKIIDYEKQNNCKITWFKASNGYICGNNKLYIHQVITGCYGNGKGTSNISVDHIDRNPLNNSFINLRISQFEEQHSNAKGIISGTKRDRKVNARPLPDGITQDMLRKYVVYYKDYADKEKRKLREYFKVEKHPKLSKIWMTTKSNKVSIFDKLAQANKIVDDLENDMYP